MKHVLCRREADDLLDSGEITISRDGRVRAALRPKDAPLPTTPEELRYRYRLMALHWETVRLKYPTKPALTGYVTEHWAQHVEWLLGEEVYEQTVKEPAHGVTYRPSWEILLEYEYELCRKAMNRSTRTTA